MGNVLTSKSGLANFLARGKPTVTSMIRTYDIPGFDTPLDMFVTPYYVTAVTPIPEYATYQLYHRTTFLNRTEIWHEETRKKYEAWFALALLNGYFE